MWYSAFFVFRMSLLPADLVQPETVNLMEARGHYHKYVVAMNDLTTSDSNDIQLVHVAGFLLME